MIIFEKYIGDFEGFLNHSGYSLEQVRQDGPLNSFVEAFQFGDELMYCKDSVESVYFLLRNEKLVRSLYVA